MVTDRRQQLVIDYLELAVKKGRSISQIREMLSSHGVDGCDDYLTAIEAGYPIEALKKYSDLPPHFFSTPVLNQISGTNLHILISCKSGAGKSTTLKTILFLILLRRPHSTLRIVDPKNGGWFGLESKHGVVHYLSGDDEEQLSTCAAAVREVWGIMSVRIRTDQNALRQGKPVGEYPHVYLVIDEWFSVYDMFSLFPQKRAMELGFNDLHQKVCDIIRKGREMNVHVILVAQSHTKESTGISPTLRQSLGFVCQGFIAPNGDGGYDSIEAAMGDQYLFSTREKRDRLAESFSQSIAAFPRQAKMLWSMSELSIIHELPDLSAIKSIKSVDYSPSLVTPDKMPGPWDAVKGGERQPPPGAMVLGGDLGLDRLTSALSELSDQTEPVLSDNERRDREDWEKIRELVEQGKEDPRYIGPVLSPNDDRWRDGGRASRDLKKRFLELKQKFMPQGAGQ